ncbi:MAG: type VI secretion system-associated protein TagF [Pseudomonadota bacterium]
MGVGVFGKLPDQRDYVQHGMDANLMTLIDPWIQQSLQNSQAQLGGAWLDVYLCAPIWRFWIGAAVVGRTTLGAVMPSVDGVGRYFPLFLTWTGDERLDAPEINPQDPWFDAAEHALLAALSEEGTYRGLLDAIAALQEPEAATNAAGQDDHVAALLKLRVSHQRDFYDPLSFWWVPASPDGGIQAQAHMWRGLPSALEYAMLLTAGRTEQSELASGG